MFKTAIALFAYLNNYLNTKNIVKNNQKKIDELLKKEQKLYNEMNHLPEIENSEVHKLRKEFIDNPQLPLVYYASDKVLLDILKVKPIEYKKVSFVVIANPKAILDKFASAKKINKNIIQIMWGLKPFIIYCCNVSLDRCNSLIINPYIKIHKPLFTIDCILQSKFGYLDCTFNDNKYSALKDAQNNILRIINFDRKSDIVLPSLLRLAQTNFNFDTSSLYYLKSKVKDINEKSYNLFIDIFKSKYFYDTMKYISMTQLLDNTVFKDDIKIISENLYKLEKYKNYNLSFEEKYIILFIDDIKNSYIYKNLMNSFQKYQVEWINRNLHLFDAEDEEIRLNIYNSMDSLIKKYGIKLLQILLNKTRNVNIVLNNKISLQKFEFCLCGRPYFKEQLYIDDDELKEIFNNNSDELKEKIIKNILSLKRYPKNLKEYLINNKEEIVK